MRCFYIFKINKEIYSLYINNSKEIYNILKQISTMNKYDCIYAKDLYKELGDKIDKDELDLKIYIMLHKIYSYKKDNNKHIYNNLYLNEDSYMYINNCYIKITSNKSIPYFLKVLNMIDDRYFVCDFTNNDYFFLTNIKKLV